MVKSTQNSVVFIPRFTPVESGTLFRPDATKQDALPEDMEVPAATGAGFVIDAAGHMLTNYYAVWDAADLLVRLRGNPRESAASVVGAAPNYDLALLSIQGVPAS